MLYIKNHSYTDADLCFSLRTYKDADRLFLCLDNLRKHYPRARVIVISDGDPDIKKTDLLEYKVEFHHGEHLYYPGAGGKIIQRMIELFLFRNNCSQKFLMKIDTDTTIHRRFKWIPDGYGMCGTLQNDGWINSIQGGFIGLDFHVVADIYRSGLCAWPGLEDYALTYALSPFIQNYCKTRLGEDWIFGYIAARLGIPLFGFEEVCCQWLDIPENHDTIYAVTHPSYEKER
jgi:hypothetical protein